jgi:hypothetical protein
VHSHEALLIGKRVWAIPVKEIVLHVTRSFWGTIGDYGIVLL